MECDTLDATRPLFNLKGVDILTDRSAYNVALSPSALASKFADPAKVALIAKGVEEAHKKGVKYKFIFNVTPPQNPPTNANLTLHVNDLNALLPAGVPHVQLQDFLTMDIE